MRALIVEDNDIAGVALGLNLQRAKCDFDIAPNGISAINLFNQYDYDLVFLDLGLPDLKGTTIAKIFRAYPSSKKDIPIVAITANGDSSQNEKAALDAGIDVFVLKPADPQCIYHLLDQFAPAGSY